MSLCVCTHARRFLKRPDEGMDLLELDLWVVVSLWIWLLGTEIWPSVRAV